MSRRQRSVVITMLGASVVGLATLAGCSPLPGNTLDPVFLKYGDKPGPAPTQIAAPPTKGSAPVESKITGTSVWVGRYRDSRGDGEIIFSLVRREATLSGIWSGKLTFRMENTAPECPGTFEGWLQVGETTGMIGAYHGKDCEGVVSDGRFDLRSR